MRTPPPPSAGILRIPGTVQADTRAYREHVTRFCNRQTEPVAFRAYRVPMGVYEQRKAGTYMVRTRIGAGLVLPEQLEAVARLARLYGNGVAHITTRQALQIHDVAIENTPFVLEGLLAAGISTRGGGGNTVRNVTACARAGVCPHEVFDVGGHAVAVAEYLLQDAGSFNLPRKYKIVFSGCARDCARASLADLGFFAQLRDGQRGFAVYAGGGLGGSPRVAIPLEDFVPETEVFAVAEAIKRLFDRHGDRSDKRRARLRFVVKRLGEAAFRDLYGAERAALAETGLSDPVPPLRDLGGEFRRDVSDLGGPDLRADLDVLPEKDPATVSLRVSLVRGDIEADDLDAVARAARQFSRGLIRCTQDQNLLLTEIPLGTLQALAATLTDRGLAIARRRRPQVVSCAGAATCKLGLCLSRGLAEAVTAALAAVDVPEALADTAVRISGCPNGCGRHYDGDIGLQGRAQRIEGRLLPAYDVLAGAHIGQGATRLAQRIGTLPARRIPTLLARAYAGGDLSPAALTALIAALQPSGPGDIAEAEYRDLGADEPFSLAGRGPGECGAGVLDIVRADLDRARQTLEEDPRQAVLAAARALLVIFGVEAKTEAEIAAGFATHLVTPGWVTPAAGALVRGGAEPAAARDLVERIEALFRSLNASLQFTIDPVAAPATPVSEAEPAVAEIDLRGVTCPLNFVKAKLALERVAVGADLRILLDPGAPAENVPASFRQQGQAVRDIASVDDHIAVTVCRTH